MRGRAIIRRHRDVAVCIFRVRDLQILCIDKEFNSFCRENVPEGSGNLVILSTDDLRSLFQYRHAATEATIHLREFQADVAAADDNQMFRQEVHVHHG